MNQPKTKVYRHELLPTHFLERAGEAYADRIAVVDGEVEYTWRDFRTRARRFASALQAQGLEKGDRIAFSCVELRALAPRPFWCATRRRNAREHQHASVG